MTIAAQNSKRLTLDMIREAASSTGYRVDCIGGPLDERRRCGVPFAVYAASQGGWPNFDEAWLNARGFSLMYWEAFTRACDDDKPDLPLNAPDAIAGHEDGRAARAEFTRFANQ